MLSFAPQFPPGRPPRLLFLGAHSDDIEIGCGGTVLRLVRERAGAAIRWVVFGCTPPRAEEARQAAADFLADAASPHVETLDFPDSFFPSRVADIKLAFERLKEFQPDLIFTHAAHDMHQDHRVVNELTWNTFRNHAILEYEVPKYDADLRPPSVYAPVDAETCRRKTDLLGRHFASQRAKHWFDEEVFRGLMRLRGLECCSPSGYAEAFHARKLVI